MRTTERVPFRRLHMPCCGTLLCWVNPRLPSFCPECGTICLSQVKEWVTTHDPQAILKVEMP
jgi:hypothetical protein